MPTLHVVLPPRFAYFACVTGHWFRDGARGWFGATVALWALLTATSRVQAQPAQSAAGEPFRLVWSSSAGCGQARSFVAELAEKTQLLREARAEEHAITLIVETFRTAAGVRGQLTVHKPDGDLTVRDVPGANCQEVQSALALIAALMVDPLATRSARRHRDYPASAARPSDTSRERSHEWSLRLEHHLTIRTAVAPGWSWGQSVGLTWTRETRGFFRPSLGISAHAASAVVSAAPGSAELDWAAGQLAACPVAIGDARRAVLTACAVFQLGRLRGVGFSTVEPASHDVLWSSAGLELQGRHHLLGPLWLGWEGAFLLPLTRASFYFEPDPPLHRVPAWGLSFGIGAGLHFF
jgi:hypothetical protein